MYFKEIKKKKLSSASTIRFPLPTKGSSRNMEICQQQSDFLVNSRIEKFIGIAISIDNGN